MALDRTDYTVLGMMLIGVALFTTDVLLLPQTGSWWVLGEVGIGLGLAALIVGIVVSLRRAYESRKP